MAFNSGLSSLITNVLAYLLVFSTCLVHLASAKDLREVDFIVVGAGTAGSVIADRLSECPEYEVMAIDAGDEPPIESLLPGLFAVLPHTKYDWNFTSENDHYIAQSHTIKALNLTSGRVIGGGSSINFMLYVRGCADDYNTWAEAAKDDSWRYENLFPYFVKSERLESEEILQSSAKVYHGTEGFLGITRENRSETTKYLEAFEEVGNELVFDINTGDTIGYTLPLLAISNGTRQTTALPILEASKKRENLHLLKNTFVTKILFDENNNAIGVKAIRNGKTFVIKARREVILCAGALNSAKLLMLSGVGPAEQLQSFGIRVRSDLPVGMNLQDHVLLIFSLTMDESSEPPETADPRQLPFPTVTGYGTINASDICPKYQVINFLVPNDSDAPYNLSTFNFGFEKAVCQNMLEAGKGRNTVFVTLDLLQPRSKGNTTLRSKNPYDPPVVNLGTLSDPRDVDDLVSSVEDYLRVLNSTYFQSVNSEFVQLDIPRCYGLEFGTKEYLRCYVREMSTTMCHFCGTTGLGWVVDNRLRVFNVTGLRAADGGIMPAPPSGNPTAAIIMIAEKAAEMIKEDTEFNNQCSKN